MKIGIAAHHLEVNGCGGSTYFESLIEGIRRVDNANSYELYVNDPKHSFYRKVRSDPRFTLRILSWMNFINNPTKIGLFTYKYPVDVLHVQYIAPPFYRGKLLLIIHDIAFYHFPGNFSQATRAKMNTLVPYFARRADRIITDSLFSKQDISEHYKVVPEKITVIYAAADERFKTLDDIDEGRIVLKNYGIDGPFILSVGRLDRRKNLERLIQAFGIFRLNCKYNYKLVIVGRKEEVEVPIKSIVQKSNYVNDIIVTGLIPDRDLPKYYGLSEMFIYPSLYEGFGLPILEAMACGCPVVTSNITSMPEIAGNAAVLVDPYSPESIAVAMQLIASDQRKRQELVELGFKRSAQFSWDQTARETIKIYHELCST
jgi:glycosyltransferase involved in cell wall biosynthesis